MPLFLLPFLGSGFVPTDSLPAATRWFAEYQPFTPIMETVRGLLLGHPDRVERRAGRRVVGRRRAARVPVGEAALQPRPEVLVRPAEFPGRERELLGAPGTCQQPPRVVVQGSRRCRARARRARWRSRRACAGVVGGAPTESVSEPGPSIVGTAPKRSSQERAHGADVLVGDPLADDRAQTLDHVRRAVGRHEQERGRARRCPAGGALRRPRRRCTGGSRACRPSAPGNGPGVSAPGVRSTDRRRAGAVPAALPAQPLANSSGSYSASPQHGPEAGVREDCAPAGGEVEGVRHGTVAGPVVRAPASGRQLDVGDDGRRRGRRRRRRERSTGAGRRPWPAGGRSQAGCRRGRGSPGEETGSGLEDLGREVAGRAQRLERARRCGS